MSTTLTPDAPAPLLTTATTEEEAANLDLIIEGIIAI